MFRASWARAVGGRTLGRGAPGRAVEASTQGEIAMWWCRWLGAGCRAAIGGADASAGPCHAVRGQRAPAKRGVLYS